MKGQCIATPASSPIEQPLPNPPMKEASSLSVGDLFSSVISKVDETRQTLFSMTTNSTLGDAHSALIRDFNTSNKVWNFSLWN
ncbi:hypothetical protein HJC23_012923 [Cyclotella cryptica]|uniref:Uncharacterized protein n=1 Tax=Cyclotella cryptica TaxID=29204 RepID=A0ABD3Q410_9STRA